MTSEPSGARPATGPKADVERARAELVSALSELEDKLNVPKRLKRLRAEEPGKFFAAAGSAATVAAGLIAVGVLAVIRRR